ncbi:MAG: SMP-30/gluconolactonase/LRE family protein [Caulobacteraceae bacterium]
MKEVEIIDPAFFACVMSNAPLEKLADGFAWLEGPVWFADHGALLFSDIPNDRILRWSEAGGVEVFRQLSHFANGQTRDRQGRLISCSHQDRCLYRTEYNGALTVLAERFEGKRLNSPNDVVVKSDDTVWFTDPPYGIMTDYQGFKAEAELPANVYRLDPRSGELTVVASDFEGPNGLCFSPDERRLYVTETGGMFDPDPLQRIRVFKLSAGGAHLTGGRVFHKIDPGAADGIRCDEDGNVWSSAADGVHCIAPSGELMGKILVPSLVSNLTFGGRANSRLFICASHTLYAIYLNRRGARAP